MKTEKVVLLFLFISRTVKMRYYLLLFLFIISVNMTLSQWQHIQNGMGVNRYVYTLAIKEDLIFAGASSGGVYISTNNGNNWQQTALTAPVIHSLFQDGNYLFAGTGQQGVYYSTDNGANWIQSAMNNRTIF